VKNTQQITKAMKMVAAAKLRRAQQAIAGARPFAEKLEGLTQRLVTEIVASKPEGFDTATIHPLLKKLEGSPKVALLVVSSDRGLCGAYNTNVGKHTVRRYNELKEQGAEVSVFFAGKKALEFSKRRGVSGEILADFWTGRFNTQKSDGFANQFIGKFLAGEFTSVEILHTQFKSAISQTPAIKQVLPLAVNVSASEIESAKLKAAQEAAGEALPFIYEPKDRLEILGEVLPMQVRTQFYRCFADSLASEHGARMTSMDNATRNAASMISKLTLEANRVRQASITKELLEIIGGAEALKG
jgi:F-type H+-transporting ATPase subunit gamma